MSKIEPPLRRIISLIAPWTCFGVFFLWGWRLKDLFHHLPAYGDTLEIMWGLQWYYDSLFVRHESPFFISSVFFPQGWHPATLAHTPFFFGLLLPFFILGGGPFAYNIAAITGSMVAFAGMFRAARWYVPIVPATIAALAYAFSGPIWIRLGGHLNVLWGAALIPWLAWAITYARRHGARPKQIVMLGLIWGLMINMSQYFLFLGGILLVIYLIAWPTTEKSPFRKLCEQVRIFSSIGLIALLISLPTILLFLWARSQDHMTFWDLTHISLQGVNPNSLFIPSIFHPWLSSWIRRRIYSGPIDESGVMNLGLIAGVLALVGLWRCFKEEQTRRLFLLVCIGSILALGLLLRWNGHFVEQPNFATLTRSIWMVGHTLKPTLFDDPEPVNNFKTGVPLPGLLFVATLPTWEGVRTVSRFGLLALFGVIMLAAIGLNQLQNPIIRTVIIGIWLIEIVPLPYGPGLPMPTPHPAHDWLAAQPMQPGESVADFINPILYIEGQTLYATRFHRKPIVAGAGSQWPKVTTFFRNWYLVNPLTDANSIVVLRSYGVRYILLHMQSEAETTLLAELMNDPAFRLISCFDKPETATPWPYSICVLEVQTGSQPFDVALKQGWAEPEEWGVWAVGDRSQVNWVATAQKDYRLHLSLFPNCLPDKKQELAIIVQGTILAEHLWENCDMWDYDVMIPQSLVKIGMNQIDFAYGFAAPPEHAGNDQRRLSAGFTALEIDQSD